MESLIALLVFALIILLILPAVVSLNSNSKIKDLKREVDLLKKYILDLHKGIESIKNLPAQVQEKSPLESATPAVSQIIQKEVIVQDSPVPEAIKPLNEPKPQPKVEEPKPAAQQPLPQPASENLPPKPLQPILPQRKTNFEQFIGEKLISLVGIAILVLGIFFTVKWAIDRHLITDAGKILIGLGAATILIAVAHKLSKNYRAFSSILAGGGIAVLYFSVYQAYQSYHLLPQTAAFICMVVITLLAVVLSLVYDKKELAIIALIGGFGTPFFVSNGAGNFKILFSYLLILNAGMFILANFKKWNLLNRIGYVFTVLIFAIWTYNEYDVSKGHSSTALIFATLFYIVFFATNIIYNIRQKQKFAGIEITVLLSNSFLYLGGGLFFLQSIHNGDYQGIFVISMAVFNFAFAYLFFKNQQIDKNLIYLLIALVMTFVSLAGPVQLHGNYITLFWAAEAAILYWLGLKSNIQVIKNASVLVILLSVVSLGMDWRSNYFAAQVNRLPLIFNKAFITGMVVIAAMLLNLKWVRRDQEKMLFWGLISTSLFAHILGAAAMLVMYMVGFRELHYQSFAITRSVDFQHVIWGAWHFLFVTTLMWYVQRFCEMNVQKVLVAIAAISLLLYPVANLWVTDLRSVCLQQPEIYSLFYFHFLIPLAALGGLALMIQFLLKQHGLPGILSKWAPWFLTLAGLFILSAEMVHLWVVAAYEPGFDWSETARKAVKVAWPILWSVVSLLMMGVGMKRRIKQLRIISLALFTLTIVKLFVYDISNVGQGGKIAAFIILGVILLIVSFMYQKIKDLFTDEDDRIGKGNPSN